MDRPLSWLHSDAEEVLRHAPCPVLIVHEDVGVKPSSDLYVEAPSANVLCLDNYPDRNNRTYLSGLALAFGLVGCGKQGGTSASDRADNAVVSYVAPGEKDEYYLFYSGGHSGQIFVAGIPSLRHISTIWFTENIFAARDSDSVLPCCSCPMRRFCYSTSRD